MSSKEPLFKRIRAPMFLMVLTILLSFLVPTILAQPASPSRDYETNNIYNSDLAYDLDVYFSMMNCNDPGNSWVIVNYYFENGSSVRMVFGLDRTVFPSLNLDYQNNIIQVFDKKGKIDGFGFQSKSRSNLFIYVPV
jgi:hypothetical protein